MSWIAEYDTQGREFPSCVHVTKTTGTMTHGVTYVPIEDGKAVRAENTKLRELVADMWPHVRHRSRMCAECELPCDESDECLLYEPMRDRMHELGIEVDK